LELIDHILQNGQLLKVDSQTSLMEVGTYIKVIPLILEGSVKIFREDDEGHELFLYYLQSGQSCAMTLASTLKMEKSKVKAITQEPTTLFAVKAETVYDLYRKYPSWQQFVIETFSTRFDEMLQALDSIAFYHLDERLEKYLQDKAQTLQTRTLQISHQEIADDLASSREVISRLLKQMEKKGLVQLSRGQVVLKT
jgi:CRP/FNR family transcriptional regulator